METDKLDMTGKVDQTDAFIQFFESYPLAKERPMEDFYGGLLPLRTPLIYDAGTESDSPIHP